VKGGTNTPSILVVVAIGGQRCDAAMSLALLRVACWSASMWVVSVRYSVVALDGGALHCNTSPHMGISDT
jgi:hypothetical protein